MRYLWMHIAGHNYRGASLLKENKENGCVMIAWWFLIKSTAMIDLAETKYQSEFRYKALKL